MLLIGWICIYFGMLSNTNHQKRLSILLGWLDHQKKGPISATNTFTKTFLPFNIWRKHVHLLVQIGSWVIWWFILFTKHLNKLRSTLQETGWLCWFTKASHQCSARLHFQPWLPPWHCYLRADRRNDRRFYERKVAPGWLVTQKGKVDGQELYNYNLFSKYCFFPGLVV